MISWLWLLTYGMILCIVCMLCSKVTGSKPHISGGAQCGMGEGPDGMQCVCAWHAMTHTHTHTHTHTCSPMQELLKRLESFVAAQFPSGLKWNAAGGSAAAAGASPAQPAPTQSRWRVLILCLLIRCSGANTSVDQNSVWGLKESAALHAVVSAKPASNCINVTCPLFLGVVCQVPIVVPCFIVHWI